MSTIYKTILDLCEKKGVSGAKMCADIGVSKSLMTSLKTGRTTTINAKTANKIAKYFDVPLGYILKDREMSLSEFLEMMADDHGITKEKPTDKVDGLRGTGYYELTPENRKVIDSLIETLLNSQSRG